MPRIIRSWRFILNSLEPNMSCRCVNGTCNFPVIPVLTQDDGHEPSWCNISLRAQGSWFHVVLLEPLPKTSLSLHPHIGSSIRIALLIPKTSQRWEVKKKTIDGCRKTQSQHLLKQLELSTTRPLTNCSQMPFKESWHKKKQRFQDPFGSTGKKTVRWNFLVYHYLIASALGCRTKDTFKVIWATLL